MLTATAKSLAITTPTMPLPPANLSSDPSFGADSMATLVEQLGSSIIPFRQSDIVEVEVIGVSKQRVLVNVRDLALGFVPQREFSLDSHRLEIGQKVLAYVLVPENEDGYVVLSLKRADRERLWRMIAEQAESGATLSVKISDANRGGLVIDYGGIEGFIPISQLASQHVPRGAAGSDERPELSSRLKELVGSQIHVKILSFDERARKLIFSEKAAGSAEAAAVIGKLTVGDKLEGAVTGIVDFGLFVDIGGIEGLVHISEISWDRIDDLRSRYHPGDKVLVQIVSIEGDKVSLSIKRLAPDPWLVSVKKYQVGDRITGAVTRITAYGAFVRLDEKIEGLVHVSEVIDRDHESDTTIESVLQVGQSYPFIILSIDPATHRLALSYRSAQAA